MFFNFRSDSAYFDGLDETILCVGLVKAKPGKVCCFSRLEKSIVWLSSTNIDFPALRVSFSLAKWARAQAYHVNGKNVN